MPLLVLANCADRSRPTPRNSRDGDLSTPLTCRPEGLYAPDQLLIRNSTLSVAVCRMKLGPGREASRRHRERPEVRPPCIDPCCHSRHREEEPHAPPQQTYRTDRFGRPDRRSLAPLRLWWRRLLERRGSRRRPRHLVPRGEPRRNRPSSTRCSSRPIRRRPAAVRPRPSSTGPTCPHGSTPASRRNWPPTSTATGPRPSRTSSASAVSSPWTATSRSSTRRTSRICRPASTVASSTRCTTCSRSPPPADRSSTTPPTSPRWAWIRISRRRPSRA